jgi:hypothetical protein
MILCSSPLADWEDRKRGLVTEITAFENARRHNEPKRQSSLEAHMAYCRACGHLNSDTASFCRACGAPQGIKMELHSPLEPMQVVTSPSSKDAKSGDQHGRMRKVFIGLAVILAHISDLNLRN